MVDISQQTFKIEDEPPHDIQIPHTAYMFGGLYPGVSRQFREHFWDMAYKKTRYLNTKEYIAYRQFIHNDQNTYYRDETATLVFTYRYDMRGTKFVKAFEIAVNEGGYLDGSKDLMKYAVEHEICEIWFKLQALRADRFKWIPHLLARKHEFRLAVKDGNGERLRQYLTLCVSNSNDRDRQVAEFEYAYNLAMKRYNFPPQLQRIYI